jgi:hypothetical protein
MPLLGKTVNVAQTFLLRLTHASLLAPQIFSPLLFLPLSLTSLECTPVAMVTPVFNIIELTGIEL